MKLERTELSLIGVAVAVAILAQFSPNWLVFTLTLAISTALVVMGVVMLMRAGLVSFGQGLFYCLGGYAVGLGGRFLGITDALMLVGLGVGVTVAISMVLGLLVTRYREIFFAMLSLAFSMILYGVLVKSHDLGSTDGFGVVDWSILGYQPGTGESGTRAALLLALVIALAIALFLNRYFKSSLGLACEAIRENEVRVEYMGISRQQVLYINYVIAAAIGSVGGSMTALTAGHVDPTMAYWTISGEFVFIAILGGTGHVAAPFIAALIFTLVRTYAVELAPNAWQMILGIVLLLIILFLPKGIWSLFTRKRRTAS
ncbi:amino acid/amide ABC transporter membrane protein 2, HAAT family [Marinobacter daqiaonensis]|uniref:Amino acid/amide ABC transporter membrane protein 2, HAAT family n=1 Tax=Marinobacter daqiaonensis TaxID=650891 RepID=A0A1I6IBV8_9GAMM|nr:branched-chain amino acid ABC transporter permease [Marinobacter daqiaonensis]SFR64173.1 amino acid/amide ABC transporter membrane protein 2, HAAT family [Marinobacter daqiaonensis]